MCIRDSPIGACLSGQDFYRFSCYGSPGSAFSPLAALSVKTCGGASLPLTASSTGLSCYSGYATTAGSWVSIMPSTVNKVCFAVTGRLTYNESGMIVGQRVRKYSSIESLDSEHVRFITMGLSDVADVVICTSNTVSYTHLTLPTKRIV